MSPIAEHSDDLPQASPLYSEHPKAVPSASYVDPASRRTKGMYEQLSMASVGLEFGLSVIIGLVAGRWLDAKLGIGPWMMIVFLCLGFAAGTRGLLRAVKREDRKAERELAARQTTAAGTEARPTAREELSRG